jgi:hypothetical protein
MNESTIETLTLENLGDIDLNYSISIQNTTEDNKNLTGSTVECAAEGFTPGETVTWTFTVTCASDDNEWIKDLWIEFPAGVVINSSTALVGGSGGDIPSDGCTGDGVTVHWGGAGYMANGQTATTDVSVTISSAFVGDIALPWTIEGDHWGSDPHIIEGEMNIVSLGEPLTWLTLNVVSGTLGSHDSDDIDVIFDTTDLEYGTYTANIVIQHSAGENVIIPVVLICGLQDSPEDILPVATQLSGNYPNPFNPTTTISFDLHKNSQVELVVYNVKGQKVKTLVNEAMNAGKHRISWNGKDDSERPTSSGIYFYRFSTKNQDGGRYTATKKMILMK